MTSRGRHWAGSAGKIGGRGRGRGGGVASRVEGWHVPIVTLSLLLAHTWSDIEYSAVSEFLQPTEGAVELV